MKIEKSAKCKLTTEGCFTRSGETHMKSASDNPTFKVFFFCSMVLCLSCTLLLSWEGVVLVKDLKFSNFYLNFNIQKKKSPVKSPKALKRIYITATNHKVVNIWECKMDLIPRQTSFCERARSKDQTTYSGQTTYSWSNRVFRIRGSDRAPRIRSRTKAQTAYSASDRVLKSRPRTQEQMAQSGSDRALRTVRALRIRPRCQD